MSEQPTPANSAPAEDFGAETSHRFGYQDAWSSILACSLLEESAEFTELYCEHHEDILLRLTNGKFKGVQVKTRNLSADPWKTNDDEIIKTISRFALLDSQFPDLFEEFILATNHFFYEALQNGQNLPHVLSTAKETINDTKIPASIKRLISRLSKTTKLSDTEILGTLKKTSCTATLPKMDDIKKVLRETIIRTYLPARDAVFSVLGQSAKLLVSEIREASSLKHRDSLPAYLSLLKNPETLEARKRIEGKLFTADRVRHVLSKAMFGAPLLVPNLATESLSRSEAHNRIERKLEAGGLSVVSINMAKDFSASALHLFSEWRARFGDDEALRRYNHLKTLVLKDCASAYEESKGNGEIFGRPMQNNLRDRFKERMKADRSAVFDCSEEHLEGCAYELTGACKVWWSKPFKLGDS